MKLARLLLGAALLLGLAGPSVAGRPLSTEDAGVLDPGSCELESYLGLSREPASPDSRLQSVQLGCGAVEGTQLALLHQRGRSGATRTRSLAVAGKTRLHDGGEAHPSWALAWGLGQTDDGSGAGLRADQAYLNGVASWPLSAHLMLHGNLGWSHSRLAGQSRTSWAVALEKAATDHLDLMGELFDDDRSHSPWLQLGLRWAVLPDRLWLDASQGWQSGGTRARAFTLGLRLAF